MLFLILYSLQSPFLKIDSASSTRPKPGIYSYVSDFVSKNLTSNATSSSTQTITVSDNSGMRLVILLLVMAYHQEQLLQIYQEQQLQYLTGWLVEV